MVDALLSGLLAVFEWPAIGYLMLGVFIGIWLGAVPGLGGIIGLVLLLPFTFDMDPVPAFALLLGMFAVTSTSDTIASVMLGIPGTAASQATILDGYPLAKQGQAARAFGAAFTVSAFGGIFGALILAVSLPLLLPIILAFGSPELFMLGMLGLTMVGSLSGGSILKGLVVAALGILMSTVGYAEAVAIPRYYFGTDYLIDGLPLIPVVLGLFALPELSELATRNSSISRTAQHYDSGSGMLKGVQDAFEHWWLTLKSAAIGTYVGMLPGLGAAVVDWIAYGHAVQSAKDKSKFGSGDIRGVIAPEAANNATRGGALLPTVAFGIPGSLGTAILLGALLIQGLKPGPEMLTTELPLTFSIVWSIVIANIVASILLMLVSRQVARVAFVPGHLLVPGVILFIFMGAWLGGASMGDWVTCIIMGVLGVLMKRSGWPRPPLVLALILGSIMENSFHISMLGYGGASWLANPVVVVILILIFITVLLAIRSTAKTPKVGKDGIIAREGSERDSILSVHLSLTLFLLFLWAGREALAWPSSVSQFPLVANTLGACLVFLVLIRDWQNIRANRNEHGGIWIVLQRSAAKARLNLEAQFYGYLAAMFVLSQIIGQKLAIPLFIFIYLLRWGKYSYSVAFFYAVCGWTILILFYDKVMHLLWYRSWISNWLPTILPNAIPAWLFL